MDNPIEYWNGPAAEGWLREQALRDRMLASYGDAALRAAVVGGGESVLDVGCGCGATSISLSDLVGAGGRVVGVDVSSPMVARARELAAGRENLTFLVADATTADLGAGGFDLLFSRFGVMFFVDPVAAFSHLRGALRPGGRLAFVCWRGAPENPWAYLPLQAAAQVLGAPPAPPPEAPGPFSFASAERVRAILDGAGFTSVDAAPFGTRFSYGASLETAASLLVSMGPASRLLDGAAPDVVARVVARTREAIAPFFTGSAVEVPGAAWVVTARRS